MMKRLTLLFSLLMLLTPAYSVDRLLMARTEQAFPEAMLKLQETIKKHGYTVSRVQRVDIGLTQFGYETDKYRVVFFGKAEEIRRMSSEYPQLIPYLPLKIAIFAEEEDTLMVSFSPLQLMETDEPELNSVLENWTADLQAMLADMRNDNE
ncbi:DUF302 domain-containing protein [Thiohalophilus thiocyanatoxydans]|uniref:Uncharacterized protein (DUF302 family) n=1 Tax=Thiohalophilus thiocyanatoxydans TaxID=381308 RepID=A0A4R8ITJ3_9GAMM|nr:DUF302 domain-containing protein [Thiohalophilus thiocyanatoxydans]TDY03734.1 uncharacterized protein (DUF302 family) [Thiohalophilus thiocyanatoxydans]